jgi:hypothetical protein
MILSEDNITNAHDDVIAVEADDDTEAKVEDGLNDLTLGQLVILFYLGLVFISAVALNLSILMVFIRKSALRTTSNRCDFKYCLF